MALLDDELHALYALRPDDFVRARNELARALRKEGRRDDAEAAAKLRRPSVTAAALNHVALEEPALVETLMEQEARLRDAMERAVNGNADDVRPAQAAARRASDAVVTAARRRLEQLGHHDSDAAAQRISNTLRAAALDGALSQRLRRGTLETDVVASGFGFGDLAFDDSAPSTETRKRVAKGIATPAAPLDDGQKAKERAARHAAAKTEAKRLAATAAKLAAAAATAQRRLEDVREQTERLQERIRALEREALQATKNAEKSAQEALRAEERVAALEAERGPALHR